MATEKCTVLANTAGLTREAWLAARQQGIGGSDAGPITGTSKWASPYSVWVDKTGRATSTFNGNHATELGNHLERPIAELYAKTANKAVIAIPVLLRSIEHRFMLANVDFFIAADDAGFEKGKVTDVPHWADRPELEAILEIKTGGLASWTNHATWDNDNVPINYLLQGIHYAAVTGIHKVTYAALLGGQGLTIRDIEVSQADIDTLVEQEQNFWHHVVGDFPPEPTGADIDLELIRAQYSTTEPGTVVQADDFLAETIEQYREAKELADQAEQRVKGLRAKIELALAGNEAIEYQGQIMLTYKSNKSSEAIDTKTMVAENPELAAQYKTSKPGARVLRLAR